MPLSVLRIGIRATFLTIRRISGPATGGTTYLSIVFRQALSILRSVQVLSIT